MNFSGRANAYNTMGTTTAPSGHGFGYGTLSHATHDKRLTRLTGPFNAPAFPWTPFAGVPQLQGAQDAFSPAPTNYNWVDAEFARVLTECTYSELATRRPATYPVTDDSTLYGDPSASAATTEQFLETTFPELRVYGDEQPPGFQQQATPTNTSHWPISTSALRFSNRRPSSL